MSLEEVVQNITELLLHAWQYPETAHVRIMLDGITYTTSGVRDCRQNQTAEIVVDGMPGTCKIIVETKFSDRNVYLTVKDTGISMNKEILDKIFMPFFTTRDYATLTFKNSFNFSLVYIHYILDSTDLCCLVRQRCYIVSVHIFHSKFPAARH